VNVGGTQASASEIKMLSSVQQMFVEGLRQRFAVHQHGALANYSDMS
jgi:hypothetical protein